MVIRFFSLNHSCNNLLRYFAFGLTRNSFDRFLHKAQIG